MLDQIIKTKRDRINILKEHYVINDRLDLKPTKFFYTLLETSNIYKIIGEIKLDAMFSPVVKATYKVENSRVGQVTDFDKLVFEVETNGAINPDDAIALAARILQDQLQPFINFDEPEVLPDQSSAEPLSFNSNLLKKVEELELSVRSANCLKNDENVIFFSICENTKC